MTNSNVMKCAAVGVAVLSLAAVAAGPGTTYTGTLTISNLTGVTQYTLQSDGNPSASYPATFTPTASEPTYFQLNLDLDSSRSLLVTLTPVNGSPAGPFVGPLPFSGGTVVSRCFTPGGTSSYQAWPAISPNTPDTNCAMRVNFTYNDVSYTLVMSPEYPGTGTATVSCTNWNAASNACIGWTDTPTLGANQSVAFLYQNGKKGDILLGSYSMTFNWTVTHP